MSREIRGRRQHWRWAACRLRSLALCVLLCWSGLACDMEEPVAPPPPEPLAPPPPVVQFMKLGITGRVTDGGGEPVAGALVIATVVPDYTVPARSCPFRVQGTGGRTDAEGRYFNDWGTPGKRDSACVSVTATFEGLIASIDGVRVGIPDTVTINLVLQENP